MGLRFLLDTKAISYARVAPESFSQYLIEGAMGSPTWHELVFGLRRMPTGRKKDEIQRFLMAMRQSMRVLPYGRRAADWHGAERARLAALGVPRPFVDGQIAAIARTRSLILVTANAKDFVDYDGLVVESIPPRSNAQSRDDER